jgi:hypothetical protein
MRPSTTDHRGTDRPLSRTAHGGARQTEHRPRTRDEHSWCTASGGPVGRDREAGDPRRRTQVLPIDLPIDFGSLRPADGCMSPPRRTVRPAQRLRAEFPAPCQGEGRGFESRRPLQIVPGQGPLRRPLMRVPIRLPIVSAELRPGRGGPGRGAVRRDALLRRHEQQAPSSWPAQGDGRHGMGGFVGTVGWIAMFPVSVSV